MRLLAVRHVLAMPIRYSRGMDSGEVKILVGLLLVLAAAGAWFYWDYRTSGALLCQVEPGKTCTLTAVVKR